MLKLGYYNSDEMRDEAIRLLVENIKNENPKTGSVRAYYGKNSLAVGFLGSNVITPVLSDIGYSDVSYDLLLNDDMPSWLFEVKAGATTIWERWNSYSPGIGFGDSEMNSFNHFAYGSVAEWMYAYMAGISSDAKTPGFKHIILQPSPDKGQRYNSEERINHVNGSYESYYGMIKSEWSAEDGEITEYHAEIPANTTATLYLPVPETVTTVSDTVGVQFKSITEHNGYRAAEIELISGGFDFHINSGAVISENSEGYTDIEKTTVSNISYKDDAVCFTVYNGEGESYNCYAAEYDGSGVLAGVNMLDSEVSSPKEELRIPYKKKNENNILRLFVWNDMEPLTEPVVVKPYIDEGGSGSVINKEYITEKNYSFVNDAIKSGGSRGTSKEVLEWSISDTPQYFSFGIVDFDAVESITISSGYRQNSAVTSIYAYDNNGAYLGSNKFKELCVETEPFGKSIGSIADSKTGEWGYRSCTVSENAVTIDEGELYVLQSGVSKTLSIPANTGKKNLVVGIEGENIGKAYFSELTVKFKYPVEKY